MQIMKENNKENFRLLKPGQREQNQRISKAKAGKTGFR